MRTGGVGFTSDMFWYFTDYLSVGYSFFFDKVSVVQLDSYDLRKAYGSNCQALHHVFQQDYCPACFAFALASVLGTRMCMRLTNSTVVGASMVETMPSPFRIFDCGGGDCSEEGKGLNALSLMKVMKVGVPTIEQTPPIFGWGCQKGRIQSKDVKTLCGVHQIQRELLLHGPSILYVDLRKDSQLLSQFSEWQPFLQDPNRNEEMISGHSVMIVGWSSVPTGHWIVKNSWGAEWGQNGFGRVPWMQKNCVLVFDPLILS